jgi:hypothetical protein
MPHLLEDKLSNETMIYFEYYGVGVMKPPNGSFLIELGAHC